MSKQNQKIRWAFIPFSNTRYKGRFATSLQAFRNATCFHVTFMEFYGMVGVFDESETYIGHMIPMNPSAAGSPILL